jgi:5-epi-alpha-selinene synthase
MAMQAEAHPEPAVVRELRLLLPQPGGDAPDPASSSFCRIVDALSVDRDEAINGHIDAITGPLSAWAVEHGLAGEAVIADRLEKVCFNVLAAYTYPRAPREEFLLAAKWCTWLFFHDDWLCDRQATEDEAPVSPGELAIAHRRLLRALEGQAPKGGDPLATSLYELGREALRWGGEEWMARFVFDVRRHFEANEWEAVNRARNEVPSVEAYTKMRPYAGAVYTAFDFIELVEDLDIDPTVREHVAFRQLALIANNCICWVNDLYSLAKEIHEGNPNNLVLALREERGIGLGEAMIVAVDMHNAEYRAFESLAGDLKSLGVNVDRDVRDYLAGLRAWMLGNAAWSRLTLRYQELLNMTV